MDDRKQLAVALDVGRARIGVAITDAAAQIAMPLAVVHRKGTRRDLDAIMRLVEQHQVAQWIVGLPPATPSADAMNRLATNFALALATRLQAHVWLVDEAATTAQAQQELRQHGMKNARRRKVVDKVAAKLILDRWLAGAIAERVSPNAPQPETGPSQGANDQ